MLILFNMFGLNRFMKLVISKFTEVLYVKRKGEELIFNIFFTKGK